MPNRKVSLIRLCKTENGWRRYPAVIGKNGRPKPGYVLVNGEERLFPEGRYQLRTYVGSKMVYTDAGEHAADAVNEQQRKAALLAAKELAAEGGFKVDEGPKRVNLRTALREFLEVTKARGSMEAAEVYRTANEEFLTVTGRTYADEITPRDIAIFQAALRKRSLSDRTVANRHSYVIAFLRFLKLDTKHLAPHKPRYEKSLPEVYTEAELKAFFAGIEDSLRLPFELLLQTGMREQEAIHLEWPSVNFERGTIRVRANAKYGFTVKDYEQRDVPVSPALMERLKERKAKGGTLVLGTKEDKPNVKLLRTLKRAAKNAGVNCGSCESCIARGECERWFLHKFRATFVTTMLRKGMDLRTVMKLSGHSDLDSVMRYLSPASDEAIRNRVAAVQWY